MRETCKFLSCISAQTPEANEEDLVLPSNMLCIPKKFTNVGSKTVATENLAELTD